MPLAVIKTNLSSVDGRFVSKFEDFIQEFIGCDSSLTMVELHTGLVMSRDGSQSPMLNMEFHHNEERIHALTKKEYASKFANFLHQEMKIPVSRILILFMDTRCTTLESTAL